MMTFKNCWTRVLLPVVVLSLGACASAPPLVPTQIVSNPSGATILINGSEQGETPLDYLFDFQGTPEYELIAKREGYFDKKTRVAASNPPGEQLSVSLEQSQAWVATSPSDATNSWLRVRVNPGFSSEHVWRRMVDAVTAGYVELEQFNFESGYLRSVYKTRRFPSPKGEFLIRNRFVAAITSQEPLVYKLKVASEWAYPGGKWLPYNRIFKEDAAMVEEIRSQFGVL